MPDLLLPNLPMEHAFNRCQTVFPTRRGYRCTLDCPKRQIPFEYDINNFSRLYDFLLDTANAILSLPRAFSSRLNVFAGDGPPHQLGLAAWYLCLQIVKDQRAAVVAGAAFPVFRL